MERKFNFFDKRPPETVAGSSFFHLKLVFERHAFDSAKEIPKRRAKYLKQFRSFFKKGEKNIFMDEAAGLNPEEHEFRTNTLQAKYAEFGSFSKAALYADLALTVHKNPSVSAILDIFDSEYENRTQFENHSHTVHRLAVHDALDDLVAEGFQIDLVLEPPITIEREEVDMANALESALKTGNMDFIRQLGIEFDDRNQAIIEYIKQIEQSAKDTKKKTNLLIHLGAHHVRLLEDLPEETRNAATIKLDVPDVSRGFKREINQKGR